MQENLDDLNLFYQLKEAILYKYNQAYPYWTGNLENFGNKEIAQLLDLIETDTRQKISEKWVYTHLKPSTNTKLPRKDMLDILSIWVDYSGWDEFKVKKQASHQKKNSLSIRVAIIVVSLIVLGLFGMMISGLSLTKNEYQLCFYDQYTQKKIAPINFSVFLINDKGDTILQQANDNCLNIKNEYDKIKLQITSPYYKNISFDSYTNKERSTIYLQPDDYAMMLRAYMNSNVKDWKKRRKQLNEVILDDAEIIEVMNDNIGVEFLNKEEFIDKITIPLESTKRMEIIDIKYQGYNKIIELKFIQKNNDE